MAAADHVDLFIFRVFDLCRTGQSVIRRRSRDY